MIAAASDPAPGSVIANAVIGGSSEHRGATQRRRCSSVPSSASGAAKNEALPTRDPIGESPHASSSPTKHPVRTESMPPPP